MSQVIIGRRFATRFREARNALAIGREKLAFKLGVSSGTVENWETGKLPSLPNLRTVCRFFGWDELEVVGWVLEDMADREDLLRGKGRYPAFVLPLATVRAA